MILGKRIDPFTVICLSGNAVLDMTTLDVGVAVTTGVLLWIGLDTTRLLVGMMLLVGTMLLVGIMLLVAATEVVFIEVIDDTGVLDGIMLKVA